MPVGLDPLERELAEIDAEVDQIRSGMHKKFGVIPIIILLSVLITLSGLLWYTYSVGVRAGSEEAAPYLKLDGPIKVPPPNPGGVVVAHQDKTVFNRVGGNASKKEVERILPPPEKPLQPSVTTAPPLPVVKKRLKPSVAAAPPPRDSEKSKTNVVPKQELVRPPVRPKNKKSPTKITPIVRNAPVAKKNTKRKKDGVKEAGRSGKLEGSFRIQTGSLLTNSSAKKAWRKQVTKHKALLGGLKLYVVRAVVRGTVYFRVQAGPFSGRSAAVGICDKLKKLGQGCIVVRPR